MALILFITVDIIFLVLWTWDWFLESSIEHLYYRVVINFAFLAFTIALVIWTAVVYKNMRKSLEKNELLTALIKQVTLFFTIILGILSFKTITEILVTTLWFLNRIKMIDFNYTENCTFYLSKLVVDSTIEILLNYFLIYHLFRNQVIQKSEVTHQSPIKSGKEGQINSSSSEVSNKFKNKKQVGLPDQEGNVMNYTEPLLTEPFL